MFEQGKARPNRVFGGFLQIESLTIIEKLPLEL